MTNLPPPDAPVVFWIDAAGQQQGPEPLAAVIERVVADQIPATTPVWWQGEVNWVPFNTNEQLMSALQARQTPPPPAVTSYEPVTAATPAAAPADAPAPSPFAPSPFAAPVEPAAPLVFETPTTFEAPVGNGSFAPDRNGNGTPAAPAPAEPLAPEPVSAYEPAAPMPVVELPQPTYATVDAAAPTIETPVASYADAPATFVPQPEPVPEPTPEPAPVVLPEPEPPTLALGDPASLQATFADLSARGAAYAEEEHRAAGLDEQFATLVGQALAELGFAIDDRQSSGDYHSFRLTAPDGSVASVAVERLPAASTVAAVVERPVMCFVDRGGRASARLFVGDYVANGGQNVDLLRAHLASIVHAAGA